MVAEQHDESTFVEVLVAQACDDPSNLSISKSDFAVVEVIDVLAAVRFRWAIRAMGIVKMKPHEKGLPVSVIEPVEHPINGAIPPSFQHEQVLGSYHAGPHVVVVHFEAPIQSPHRIKDKRAYEGCGVVAVSTKDFSERGDIRREAGRREVTHAVEHRISSRQNHRVRGKRDGHLRVGVLEAHALGGQAIDGRSFDSRISVATEMVGAKRVDGDEKDRGRRRRVGASRP